MTNLYLCVRDSLYAALKVAAAAHSWAPSLYNFDAFAEGVKLPEGDLLGLRGLSMDADTELVTVHGFIGVATDNDPNLFRLDEMGGLFFQTFKPEAIFPIFDVKAANAEVGKLTISAGTSISPVYQAIQKPLKLLSFTGRLSLAMSQ